MLPLGAYGFDGFCFDFAVIESGRSDSLVHAIRGKDGRWPRVVAPCAEDEAPLQLAAVQLSHCMWGLHA